MPHASSQPVVVIGAGLAGLSVALRLAAERPVVVLAKRNLDEAATAWAQGGIVGVLGRDDSVESHVRDTQDAGAGLVDERGVRLEHDALGAELPCARDEERQVASQRRLAAGDADLFGPGAGRVFEAGRRRPGIDRDLVVGFRPLLAKRAGLVATPVRYDGRRSRR